MAVRIIIESSCDMCDTADFSILPMSVRFDTTEYLSGVNLTHTQFYEKLIESDVLPTTSQVSPASFEEEFKKVRECGDEAVVITVSQKLSGTYQSACIAKEDFPEIFVVDSKSVSIGIGILAKTALNLKNEGKNAKEIAEILEKEREKIVVVALLDTLEYLKKGGRISSAVAFAGALLNIKPVVSLVGGEINMLGKARGSKQGNNLLVEEITKSGGIDFEKEILLGYTGLSDLMLKKYIEDSKSLYEGHRATLEYTQIGSIVGTHAGPGAIAVAFFKK